MRNKNTDSSFKFVIVVLFILAAAASLGYCTRKAEAFSKKPPVVQPSPSLKPEPTPEIIDAYAGRELIFDIATKDVCASASYAEQGRANKGYLKGIALTYIKTICSPESDVYKIGSQPIGTPDKDALAHYGLKPETPEGRLNTVFAMMIGSNAHESSWRPCVGRDTRAKQSDVVLCLNGTYGGVKYTGTGETCEAGLDQKSYNAIEKSGPSRDLFNEYLEYPAGCFRPQYYEGITSKSCSSGDAVNHGSNKTAVAFQALQKECPGYTVESGIMGFRTIRTHWGPLNKKKAEVFPACVGMFERLRQAVIKQPSLCYVL